MSTLRPCPFCGHRPDEDNLIDSIHPVTRDHKVWQAGCLSSEGGCDAFILGGSRSDVISKWNGRGAANGTWVVPEWVGSNQPGVNRGGDK